MSKSEFAIVIATADREDLLARTLNSISEADFIQEIQSVVIADNSPDRAGKKAATQYDDKLPILYQHNSVPTKCSSLNNAVNSLDDDVFIIFFDDDVRLDKGCLKAYVDVVNNTTGSIYIGGNCAVDYEEAPPEWLKSFLPSSATGWSFGDKITPLDKPKAMGFNWGAKAGDIKRCGGFDENIGPGTPNPLGDETTMQKNLLDSDVSGVYVPDAKVYHYVPKQRCSQKWTLSRAKLRGYSDGIQLLKQDSDKRKSIPVIRMKYLIAKVLNTVMPISIFGKTSFRFQFYAIFFHSCLTAIDEGVRAKAALRKSSG